MPLAQMRCRFCGLNLPINIAIEDICSDEEGNIFCCPECLEEWLAGHQAISLTEEDNVYSDGIDGDNMEMTPDYTTMMQQYGEIRAVGGIRPTPTKPIKDKIVKQDDGKWKYTCVECGTPVIVYKEEDTNGVRLCSKCEEHYDIEHLWTDHDNGWCDAHDFNKKADLRRMYRKGKWGLSLKFQFLTMRDAEEALQTIRAEYATDLVNSGIVNNRTGGSV